jgi:ribonuclease Y
MDFEMEGTHVSIGVDLCKKYKESEAVIHAIEAHHGDVEYKTLEAMIVQVADAVSSSRPGARRESLENYIKRLEQLEEMDTNFNAYQYQQELERKRRTITRETRNNSDNDYWN